MSATTAPDHAHAVRRRWAETGTAQLLATVDRLSDCELGEPTALPGWTRRHVVAHVAANAAALRRLVRWASTGERNPMYSSPQQRSDEIEAGSLLPAGALRQWLRSSAEQLARDLDGLTDAQWDSPVVTAQGRTVPARELPWLRSREVFVHAADLAAGTAFADLPRDFLVALVGDVVARRSATGAGPSLRLRATDTGHTWSVAGVGDDVSVQAALSDLAAWLTGRPAGPLLTTDGSPVPALPAWL